MEQSRIPHLTYKVELPGGQLRLREAALYVMRECENLPYFGLTKLNKILWRADFRAFADRRVPVTGRLYQRLKQGPAPVEMRPLLDEMLRDDLIKIDPRPKGSFTEQRPIALVVPSLRYFSPDDLSYLDGSIMWFREHTGRGASKDSHGVAWETRKDGDTMPYDLALLSDDKLSDRERAKFLDLGRERHWHSL